MTSVTEGRETGNGAIDQMRALAREELHRRLSPGATAADVEGAARKLSQELFGPVVGQEWTRRGRPRYRTVGCDAGCVVTPCASWTADGGGN